MQDLIHSPSAIWPARMKHREDFAIKGKATFEQNVPLILHWDWKIREDFTVLGPDWKRVGRLLVLVSGQNVIKLLLVLKLHDGTAITMETMDKRGLWKSVKRLSFNTTASITGVEGGFCFYESDIGWPLLNLTCRHHVSEIMLEKVFSLHDVFKSPNMKIFDHFRDY